MIDITTEIYRNIAFLFSGIILGLIYIVALKISLFAKKRRQIKKEKKK